MVAGHMLIGFAYTSSSTNLDFSTSGIWQNDSIFLGYHWIASQPTHVEGHDLDQGFRNCTGQCISHDLEAVSRGMSCVGCAASRLHSGELVTAFDGCIVNDLRKHWATFQLCQWHFGAPYRTLTVRRPYIAGFYMQHRRDSALQNLSAVMLWLRDLSQNATPPSALRACTNHGLHVCSPAMAQSRAIFLEGGMDMDGEYNLGPDPHGRPPLPRRRPGSTPDGEINIRPPLPRRRPPGAAVMENDATETAAPDLQHRQLAEAVEVIARSEGRRAMPLRGREGRRSRPDLVLKEAGAEKAKAEHHRQMKEDTKTNQKLTPRKAFNVSKQAEGSTNLKRTKENKGKIATGSGQRASKTLKKAVETGSKGGPVVLQPRVDTPPQADRRTAQGSKWIRIEPVPASETQVSHEWCSPKRTAKRPSPRKTTPTRATTVSLQLHKLGR